MEKNKSVPPPEEIKIFSRRVTRRWMLKAMLWGAASTALAACGADNPPSPVQPTDAFARQAEGPRDKEAAQALYEQYHPQATGQEVRQYLVFSRSTQKITLLNYTQKFFDPTNWIAVHNAVEALAKQNLEISYGDNAVLHPQPRSFEEILLAITPESFGTPTFSNQLAATTKVSETLAIIHISEQQSGTNSLSEHGDHYLHQRSATEACQSVTQMSATVTGNTEEATWWANMGQEIYCNSLGFMANAASLGLTYEQYVELASSTPIGPGSGVSFSRIPFPQDMYDRFTKLSPVIN